MRLPAVSVPWGRPWLTDLLMPLAEPQPSLAQVPTCRMEALGQSLTGQFSKVPSAQKSQHVDSYFIPCSAPPWGPGVGRLEGGLHQPLGPSPLGLSRPPSHLVLTRVRSLEWACSTSVCLGSGV